jgi:hypothetical protein
MAKLQVEVVWKFISVNDRDISRLSPEVPASPGIYMIRGFVGNKLVTIETGQCKNIKEYFKSLEPPEKCSKELSGKMELLYEILKKMDSTYIYYAITQKDELNLAHKLIRDKYYKNTREKGFSKFITIDEKLPDIDNIKNYKLSEKFEDTIIS